MRTMKRKPMLMNLENNPMTLSNFFNDNWNEMFTKPFFADAFRDDLKFIPKIEMRQDKDHLHVVAELPGMMRDDVHVFINDDVLTIEGEKKSNMEENKDGSKYSERTYGYFRRDIAIPFTADSEKVAAKFKDGLLDIDIAAQAGSTTKTKEVNIQ